jgi:hypothetical protein
MTEEKKKNPIGRPRKRLDELNPNWKQIIFDAAQDGEGPTAWKVYLGLGHETFQNMKEDYPEFNTAVQEAMILNLHYWENEGRDLVRGRIKGNGNVYALIMNNKFGYNSSRNETKLVAEVKADVVTATRDLTKDELLAQLKSRGLPTSLLIEQKD